MPEHGNLFAQLEASRDGETFQDLLTRPGIRIERIISLGQATPADAPMVQPADEWVVLLSGAARIKLADQDEIALQAGDYVWIARDTPHWVTWTTPHEPSVWLAVHIDRSAP